MRSPFTAGRAPRRFVVALTFALFVAGKSAGAARFQGIGFLEDRPDAVSSLRGVSADGRVAVGGGTAGPGQNASFLWTRDGGLERLDPAAQSSAFRASADGSVIVGGNADRAYRWTREGGLSHLFSDPLEVSEAWDVSSDGSVLVGMRNTDQGLTPFRWTTTGGYTRLGDLQGFALGTSGDGSVAAGWIYEGPGPRSRAVRWTAGGMERLGDPGGLGSAAMAISDDGKVIVGTAGGAGDSGMFVWREGVGMRVLGWPASSPLQHAQPYDVSGDGSVVVGRTTSGDLVAVVWDEAHGIRFLKDVLTQDYGLDLTGWTLQTAFGVSADGKTIVGDARDPSGRTQGFVAVLPEPGAVVLALVAGIASLCRRRTRE